MDCISGDDYFRAHFVSQMTPNNTKSKRRNKAHTLSNKVLQVSRWYNLMTNQNKCCCDCTYTSTCMPSYNNFQNHHITCVNCKWYISCQNCCTNLWKHEEKRKWTQAEDDDSAYECTRPNSMKVSSINQRSRKYFMVRKTHHHHCYSTKRQMTKQRPPWRNHASKIPQKSPIRRSITNPSRQEYEHQWSKICISHHNQQKTLLCIWRQSPPQC